MTHHRLDKELIKELESFDPDELVGVLGITSEQLIRAFPGHAYDYVRENFTDGSQEAEDEDYEDGYRELERLLDEEYSIFDTDPGT